MKTKAAGTIAGFSLLFGGVASAVWAITYGAMQNHKGIYAGMSFDDAQHNAQTALVYTFGKNWVDNSHYGVPNVHNTHQKNVLTGTGQVRVFNVIGPRGVSYCVAVWNPEGNWLYKTDKSPGFNIGSLYSIKKGCHSG